MIIKIQAKQGRHLKSPLFGFATAEIVNSFKTKLPYLTKPNFVFNTNFCAKVNQEIFSNNFT
jgi:hypothetical protein